LFDAFRNLGDLK